MGTFYPLGRGEEMSEGEYQESLADPPGVEQDITCPYCGRLAELVTGADVYPHRRDLAGLNFWRCRPCDARVGCHQGSNTPFGPLANLTLRVARVNAHGAFDRLWKSGRQTRAQAYAWLSKELGVPPGDCHIGMFSEEQCARVMKACEVPWGHG